MMKVRTKLGLRLMTTVAFGLVAIGAAGSPASAAGPTVLKIAYSADFVPLTPEGGAAWWRGMIEEFEKENPGVKVEAIAVPGSYADVENKMSLLFRSPDSAPDVAELSNQNIVQWIDSGYLAKITDLVANDESWKGMPESVRAETTVNGEVYGISHGENEFGLLYDKSILQKAGIALPWEPKTWKDVLDAARKVKALKVDVWPLWLQTGVAQGASGASYGPNNLLVGSSDPTIYDAKTGKWVVDSRGIREVIDTYRTASAEGLLAPASQILNATAISTPPEAIAKRQLAITLGGNWFPLQWLKENSAPYYADATKDVGFAPFPTIEGAAPGAASTLSGWDLAIYAKTKKKDLAWKFVQVVQRKKNLVRGALVNGWTPPVTAYAASKEWTDLDPFQEPYQRLLPIATGIPAQSGYKAWAMGFLTATEAVVLDPKLSTEAAVEKLSDYVGNQLGADAVTTRK